MLPGTVRHTLIMDVLLGKCLRRIACGGPDREPSTLMRFCTPSSLLLSTAESLHVYSMTKRLNPPHWQDNVENTKWLDILNLFTTVKSLYPSRNNAQCIVLVVPELVGRRMTEVLSALPEHLFQRALGIEAYRGKHWIVRCCATALWSPYNYFPLEHIQTVVASLAVRVLSLAYLFHCFLVLLRLGYQLLASLN